MTSRSTSVRRRTDTGSLGRWMGGVRQGNCALTHGEPMTTQPSPTARCRAESVTPEGVSDGWTPNLFYRVQAEDGQQRIAVSAPADELGRVLRGLVAAVGESVSVLYRQKIDRRDPKPQGHPGRDFVALDQQQQAVQAAFLAADGLLACDARSEVWVRGSGGEQLVLDQDGQLFVYGAGDSVIDALASLGVPLGDGPMIGERDYVKHWFFADYDAEEDGLMRSLALTEIPVRR